MIKTISFDERLRQLCDPYEHAPVECDGLSRLLHTVLVHDQIPVTMHAGVLKVYDQVMPHFWLEVPNGTDLWLVDYRARQWFPDAPVPHGVTNAQEISGYVRYTGQPLLERPLSPLVFAILAGDIM